MNTTEILALYDEERRTGQHLPYRREETPELVRHISPHKERLNFIVYSRFTAVNADAIIHREIDYLKSRGSYGLEWKTFAHDQPADIGRYLLAHGFEADEEEALLVLDLEDCPAVFLQSVTADVRRITGPAQLSEVVAVQEAVWEEKMGWLETQLKEAMAEDPDFYSIYVAYVNNEPACAAWIAFPPQRQFASLWGGSTLPQYRNRGLYTAVVAARAQEALQRGYRFLTIDASDMSRPILQKRGFKLLTHTTPYTWKNPDFSEGS